ncbi:uncharacterized protein LOC132561174 [Ylistrum balloti]|uniref:uncharacterized protein LOC132561174 n=1 Tax=Ylistrum balloti TaxID=509963 RepID=UPI0029058D35|nr:uncharacterized protein LOC132561174 [Ylistrum balloti]
METDEDPAVASLAISNILDDAGYSEFSLMNNRHCCQLYNFFADIQYTTSGMPALGIKGRLIGSMGEGTLLFSSYNCTSCDIDMMLVLSKCEAYEDSNIHVPADRWQFHMEPCITNLGYVKLKVLQEGTVFTLPVSTSISTFFEYEEETNTHYLSNAIPATMNNFGGPINMFDMYFRSMQIENALRNQIVTGPALSRVTSGMNNRGTFVMNKVDNVISIFCPVWPSVAEEWITRKRSYGWPSNDFISKHTNCGCYVVPVGCKECDRQYLDWRLSFALVEQALVLDFNSTQIKCLLLLKQLKTFVFQDKIGDIISSYILKTIVFWVIEESPPDLWVPNRLLQTVKMCLNRIISCIQEDFCPNYFIRTCNLLTKRYTATEKQTVLKVCIFTRVNTRVLLCETTPFSDEFRSRYMEEVALDTKDLDIVLPLGTRLFSIQMKILCEEVSSFIRVPLSCQQTLQKAIEYCGKTCVEIKNISSKHDIPLQEVRCLTTEIELIRNRLLWMNTNLSSECKPRYKDTILPACRFSRIEDLMEHVIICHLNVVVGNIITSNEILRSLISQMKQLPYGRLQLPVDSILTTNNPLGLSNFIMEFANSVLNGSDSYVPFLSDIVFLRFERDILPQPLQLELCSRQSQSDLNDVTVGMRDTVAVDPLVYACFLRFWCCLKLDQNIEQLKARDDMVWCCSLPGITNKAVAFNLLGYCHQRLEEYEDAFRAFYTAWKQVPRSEATEVHIFALVYSTIRRELNETCPD